MYITGSFVNQQGDTITVHIVTGADRSEVLEIGTEASGLYFTDDPVEVNSEVNDTFDHLLRQSATIRLLARNFIPDFFSTSCRDVVVNIYKGDVCVFAGFIEPQTYSQPYNEVYDEIELNCIDALSALQYSKYKDVGALGVLYDVVKSEAAQRPLLDIMQEMLKGVTVGLDIVSSRDFPLYYDGSKAMDAGEADRYGVFSRMAISEMLFLGDDEDDVWRQDEVLEEMLRFLNLHIVQDGLAFYIFAWETLRADGSQIQWRDLVSGSDAVTSRGTVSISTDNAADCDTQISIGEVYNQLLLTCSIEGVDSIIESPLDADALTSPYRYKQKYYTEYEQKADGSVRDPVKFAAMVNGGRPYDGNSKMTDWYLRMRDNTNWRFRYTAPPSAVYPGTFPDDGLLPTPSETGDTNGQQYVPAEIGMSCGACLLQLGSIAWTTDNYGRKMEKPQMADYLALAVECAHDTTNTAATETSAKWDAARPLAQYDGEGGLLSPASDDDTNYIVISGTLRLCRSPRYSVYYDDIDSISLGDTVSGPNGDRFYTVRWYNGYVPTHRDPDDVVPANTRLSWLTPPRDAPKSYKVTDTSGGTAKDVLQCMLIVGGKCWVEAANAFGEDGWQDYKERDQCDSDDEYYAQSFHVRFDFDKDSYALDEDHSVTDSVTLAMNLDAKGQAIPITRDDALSGKVTFKIVRPVIPIYKGGRLYSGGVFGTDADFLTGDVSAVYIRNFEAKLYCEDSGGQDNDIVYMSDTQETFTNKKDDIEFKISSALTLDECRAMGVSQEVKLSTPLDTATGNGVQTIYDHTRQEQAKAEQLYVDAYYNEYHQPRIILEQHLQDKGGVAALFNLYTHPALSGKTFYVQGLSRNLIEGRADLVLKER